MAEVFCFYFYIKMIKIKNEDQALSLKIIIPIDKI